MDKDILGKAVLSHHLHRSSDPIIINNKYGKPEEMAMDILFREEADFSDIEKYAFELAKGKVLDIGAGVGSHSLALQERGFNVTAIEKSKGAIEVMKSRGIKNLIQGDIYNHSTYNIQYNTIILLMNGIGIAGTLEGYKNLLKIFEKLLAPDGQVLFDTSDVAYLYKGKSIPSADYYGELDYQFEYQNEKGSWLKWLYIDQKTLKKQSKENDWESQVIYEDDLNHYLVRLVKI